MTVTRYEGYGDGVGFDECPKGEFVRIAINPYNGKIVMVFNDNERYAPVIEGVLHQIARDVHLLRMTSGGKAGLAEYADMCDAEERPYLRPRVAKMVREGAYTAAALKKAMAS